MDDHSTPAPVRVTGLAAWHWGLRFGLDPLTATRRAHAALGPFVVLAETLPFVRRPRAPLLNVPLVLTAGAAFHRELLSDPQTWRGVSLLPGGPRNSAARRLSQGLTRATGPDHAHYRKLISSPLRRTNVSALAEKMATLAEAEVSSWPPGRPIDLSEFPRRLMRSFAVELLFGGSSEHGYFIADAVSRLMEEKWGASAFALRMNLPITAYGRMVRHSELLERRVLEWARIRRGQVDERDLVSIIVNSPDADGNPPSDATIAGQIPSLFAAAFEAGQSVLTWTLFLLAQHPRIAAELLQELRSRLGASPSLSEAGDLPYLDAVVKESMRVLPPVPFQIRVAQCDTSISGYPLPNGTRVILNTFLTNRMPHLYPDGDVFRPERWFEIAPTAFEFPVFSGRPAWLPRLLVWLDRRQDRARRHLLALSLGPRAELPDRLSRPTDHASLAAGTCTSAPSGRRVCCRNADQGRHSRPGFVAGMTAPGRRSYAGPALHSHWSVPPKLEAAGCGGLIPGPPPSLSDSATVKCGGVRSW